MCLSQYHYQSWGGKEAQIKITNAFCQFTQNSVFVGYMFVSDDIRHKPAFNI